jgi:diphthamide biosynthesis protein 4
MTLASPPDTFSDFYQILSVSRHATPIEIKTAYHRALLLFHPDKAQAASSPSTPSELISVSLIKEAYETLSKPGERARYDAILLRKNQPTGPRPAQIISLEDFQEEEDVNDGNVSWSSRCRCGGTYRITTAEMEDGKHLVGCTSCSEVVWVGYEIQDSGDEGPPISCCQSPGMVD